MIKSKPCIVEDCDFPRFAKGFCKYHQNLRTDKKAPKPLSQGTRKPIKKKYKPTGEKIVFDQISQEREHVSFVSGKSLGPNLLPINFHHVLGKKSFSRFRLYKRNIILVTAAEHRAVHEKSIEELLAKHPGWQKVFDLKEELKKEYYR